MKGHAPRKAAGGCRDATLRIFGNRAADKLAREAAKWHPAAVEVHTSTARTHLMTKRLCSSYARLLDWAVEVPGRLPDITPLESLFRKMRPPPMPEHCLAIDGNGLERCIRCMLPPTLCSGRPCRPHGKLWHSLVAFGSGIYCDKCGVYSFSQFCMIGSVCRGCPTGNGTEWRLSRMRRGRHPTKGHFIGQPQGIDTTLGVFRVLLG